MIQKKFPASFQFSRAMIEVSPRHLNTAMNDNDSFGQQPYIHAACLLSNSFEETNPGWEETLTLRRIRAALSSMAAIRSR
jgi:hypothetical protein